MGALLQPCTRCPVPLLPQHVRGQTPTCCGHACLWGHAGTAQGPLVSTAVDIKMETAFTHPSGLLLHCRCSVTIHVNVPGLGIRARCPGPSPGTQSLGREWGAIHGGRAGAGEAGVHSLGSSAFLHTGGGQGPQSMPPALSGRPALMSDSSRRLLALVKWRPTCCGPGLVAQCGLHWALASPCSRDRHRVAFTAHCLPPSTARLGFPTVGGGVPQGPLGPANLFSAWEPATPLCPPGSGPRRPAPACSRLPRLGWPGWGQSDQDCSCPSAVATADSIVPTPHGLQSWGVGGWVGSALGDRHGLNPTFQGLPGGTLGLRAEPCTRGLENPQVLNLREPPPTLAPY